MTTRRQIIHQHGFDDDLQGLFGRMQRADEFIRAAEWALHRDATCGKRLTEHIWCLDSAELPDHDGGRFVLLYTFDSSTVYLMSLVWDGSS